MSNAVFGYGSLILIPSLISRFEYVPSIDSVYEQELTYGDENLVREEVKELWKKTYSERITVHPVKISGFKRAYTWESKRGGLMLEAFNTGESDDFINGVLAVGLSDAELAGVTGTEDGYEKHLLEMDDFDSYVGEVPDFTNEITIYTSKNHSQSNVYTDRSLNLTYHSRIYAGFDFLEQLFSKDVREEVQRDFEKTTFVPPSEHIEPTEGRLAALAQFQPLCDVDIEVP